MTDIPGIGFFGRFAFGTIARVKPCLAASLILSCPLGTGRISPDKPTSPKQTKFEGKMRSRKLGTTASNNARSELVSDTRTPPTALTKTS